MTSPTWDRFRGCVAVVAALLVVSLGMRSTWAADTDNRRPQQATDTEKPPADDTDRPPAAPRLQLQDEGPSTRNSDSVRYSRSRSAATDETEERPFWKSWIFWTIAGVLVVGAVGMAVYTSSGTNSSLAPCPPEVVVSLGCFGAGR